MINIQKLESDAFRLKDLESLRNLFADLNFEYEDKPVDKQNWNQEQREIVVESRIVARKDTYLVYYIKTNSDSIKVWKEIATKIIAANNGLCLVCSHNPSGFQWIFSSISKEFTKSFTETRHIPIEIKPSIGMPRPFLEFLEAIKAEDTDKGINILNKISDAFDKFSLQIHDELTINVFEAFKALSEGIISDKSNKMILSNETLESIRKSIFILLYRIIFVLYVEDRSIFPLDNKIYFEKYSLKWIKYNWILRIRNPHSTKEYDIHSRLKQLFRLIEVGSEELGYKRNEFFMRSYYGRLFDRKINYELDEWKIPNQHYRKAIELLTSTRDKKGNQFFLDYAALEIRHLGSIYERLLEFHLTVKNNKIADLPNAEERKASGSYYTPQYVVDYIVSSSIGPIIDRIIDETSSQSNQIEKILSLNILDPAMGSGHFLIGATQYIAKRICKIENMESSAEHYVERKRDVVRRCIYGVDLNPLAVDLTALSLWLETISSEKPLTFLSAHLKVGNSLMGSKIQNILENQTTLFESGKGRDQFLKNIQDFFMFENLKDDTPRAVRTKTEKYESIKSKGSIYYDLKFLLDSKLAETFGIEIPPLGDYRAKIGENSIDFYTSDNGSRIKKIADEHRFFHWELEFPDIFYQENGRMKTDPGFDLIIGNPPYVRVQNLNYEDIDWYKRNKRTAHKRIDISILFIELSLELISKNGKICFITSNQFFKAEYGRKLRNLIKGHLKYNLDLSDIEVFKGVSTYVSILMLEKKIQDIVNYAKLSPPLNELMIDKWLKFPYSEFSDEPWEFTKYSNIKAKIYSGSTPLGEIAKFTYGIITGYDTAFIISKETLDKKNIEKKIVVPFIKPDNFESYLRKSIDKYIIFPYNIEDKIINESEFSSKNPNAYSHLKAYKRELGNRKDTRRSITEIGLRWYSIMRKMPLSLIRSNKIIFYDVGSHPNFYLDREGVSFGGGTSHSLNSDKYPNEVLLGLLNSNLLIWLIFDLCPIKLGNSRKYGLSFLERLPIKPPTSIHISQLVINVNEIMKLKSQFYEKKIRFVKGLIDTFNVSSSKKIDNFFMSDFQNLNNELLKQRVRIGSMELKQLQEKFETSRKDMSFLLNSINNLYKEIDNIVYQTYGISEDEQSIIENELKG